VDEDGASIARRRVVIRADPAMAMWVLPVIVFLSRRRRHSSDPLG
jgi:hypothetical protein